MHRMCVCGWHPGGPAGPPKILLMCGPRVCHPTASPQVTLVSAAENAGHTLQVSICHPQSNQWQRWLCFYKLRLRKLSGRDFLFLSRDRQAWVRWEEAVGAGFEGTLVWSRWGRERRRRHLLRASGGPEVQGKGWPWAQRDIWFQPRPAGSRPVLRNVCPRTALPTPSCLSPVTLLLGDTPDPCPAPTYPQGHTGAQGWGSHCHSFHTFS